MISYPAADLSERVHPRSASVGGRAPDGDLGGVRVLAVDDDGDALPLVAELLRAAGADVATVPSVADAMRALEASPPCVLIADLGMPPVDGYQLISLVRRHRDPALRAIPAAALNAYARSEDRVKALRAGFQMHLVKPVDPVELVTTVAALVRRFTADTTGLDDGS